MNNNNNRPHVITNIMENLQLIVLLCVFLCGAQSVSHISMSDTCAVGLDTYYSCVWDGEGIYESLTLDDNVVRIEFDRLQNSRVDAGNMPNLQDLYFEESPFDWGRELCSYIFNRQSDVTVHLQPFDGDPERSEICVSCNLFII